MKNGAGCYEKYSREFGGFTALLEKCNKCIAFESSVWMACMNGWTDKLRSVTNGKSSVADDWEQLEFQRREMKGVAQITLLSEKQRGEE